MLPRDFLWGVGGCSQSCLAVWFLRYEIEETWGRSMGLWPFRVSYINMTLSVGCRCTGRVAVVPTPLCRKNCNTLENSPMEMSYSTLLLTFHSPRKARKRENIYSHSKNIEQPFWVPQYDLCDLSRPHLSPAPHPSASLMWIKTGLLKVVNGNKYLTSLKDCLNSDILTQNDMKGTVLWATVRLLPNRWWRTLWNTKKSVVMIRVPLD